MLGLWGVGSCSNHTQSRHASAPLPPILTGMYDDAVRRALSVDLGTAKAVAGAPQEEEEGLKRRLWLEVARHVVQQVRE